MAPPPSPPPRSSPSPFVFSPPVRAAWDPPVPAYPPPQEPPLAEPLILRQVRGLWRRGAITKPTYATFVDYSHAQLHRLRNGVITDVDLQAALLDRFSTLDLWVPARRRPRPSGVAKRPRSEGRSKRHNNLWPVGVRGSRGKPRNNLATRRRHRREHRLVVGRSRLRRCDGVTYYWAPAASLLDRKRTARSVATQSSELTPTTQRLQPTRRRRRRRSR